MDRSVALQKAVQSGIVREGKRTLDFRSGTGIEKEHDSINQAKKFVHSSLFHDGKASKVCVTGKGAIKQARELEQYK